MKLFSYLLVTDGHMPSEIMNSTQLLTLTMALRLKPNCSSTNICENREQELCQHLYQAYCEGDPDQSSFTASTDTHEAISTRVEI